MKINSKERRSLFKINSIYKGQIISSVYYLFHRSTSDIGFIDYMFIVFCVIFRYLIVVLGFLFLPFVFCYFAIFLILFNRVELGFSKKYYDESRLMLLLYTLIFKLPFACSKFTAYSMLRAILSKKSPYKINFYSLAFNIIFINLFGSPL